MGQPGIGARQVCRVWDALLERGARLQSPGPTPQEGLATEEERGGEEEGEEDVKSRVWLKRYTIF
jgi:hypothetical protein